MRKTMVVLLLVCGIELGLNTGWGFYFGSGTQLWVLVTHLALPAIAIALGLLPPVRSRIATFLDRLRAPSPRARRGASLVIAAVSAAYLLLTATRQHRDFFPVVHDEFSYLMSARMLAGGHLWLPAHPLKYALDSFQVIVEPVYASAYFPGVALLYAPAMHLHIPAWVVSALISGAVVGLTYRVTTELIDGVAGVLAVVMLLAVRMFRMLSIMTMANTPVLLMGLVLTWAWLVWRKRAGRAAVGWALVMGIAAGWAAVTRPLDAVCFAAPIAVAILVDLWRGPWRRWVFATVAVLVGAAPFLSVQLVANRGVTGHWFTTPFRLYADRDYPGTALGFHPRPTSPEPRSPLPQKRAVYEEALASIDQHAPGKAFDQLVQKKLPMTFLYTSPHMLMLLLLPAGLLGVVRRERGVVSAVLPLFLGLYALYVFYLYHYTVIVVPVVILLILFGAEAVSRTFPAGGRTGSLMFLGLLALAVASLPELGMVQRDEMFNAPLLRDVNHRLAAIPEPAVVLFRYDPDRWVHEEPVFNADTGWPDDARIVRAHDLGAAENLAVARYYAGIGQKRDIYRYDEATHLMVRLGTAEDLAAKGKPF